MADRDILNEINDRISSRVPPKFDSHYDRLTYLLAEYKIGIYLGAIALAGFYLTGNIEFSTITVPEWLRVVMIGFGIGIIPAIAIGFYVVDRLLPDPRIDVAVLDTDPATWRLVKIPKSVWEDKVINDMPVWEPTEGIDAIITEYEYTEATDTLEVRGVNPEIADPIKMTVRDGQLKATLNELTDAKRELHAQKATEGLRRSDLEKRILNEIIHAIEQSTAIDPDAYTDVIESVDLSSDNQSYDDLKEMDLDLDSTVEQQREVQHTD